MAAADNVERVETLAMIAGRQVILTKPLEDAIAEFGPEHRVVSVTKVTPFGNYLLGWRELEPADEPADVHPYVAELEGRARTLREALFVLGRVDGVSAETYAGVQAARDTVQAQLAEQRVLLAPVGAAL